MPAIRRDDHMLSVILVLAGLGLLVVLHELGHALAARFLGMVVTDFSIGLGPSLWVRRRGGLALRLGLIPFGGFVRVEELARDDDAKPVDFSLRGVIGRLAVIAAGPLMNGLIAALIVGCAAVLFGVETGRIEGLEVTAVSPAAADQGLRVGDVVTDVGGEAVERVSQLSRALGEAGEGTVPVQLRRGGDVRRLEMRPQRAGDRVGLGARYAPLPELQPATLTAALREGALYPVEQSAILLRRWSQIFDRSSGIRPVSAVGLADRVSQSGRWSLRRAVLFLAMLSVVVGLFNLLPLPGLDGGRLVLELLEALRRRRLSRPVAIGVQVAGALLLLVSWAFVVADDVFRLD